MAPQTPVIGEEPLPDAFPLPLKSESLKPRILTYARALDRDRRHSLLQDANPTTSIDTMQTESNETATPCFLQQTIVGVVRDCSTDHAQGATREMESYTTSSSPKARAARTGSQVPLG